MDIFFQFLCFAYLLLLLLCQRALLLLCQRALLLLCQRALLLLCQRALLLLAMARCSTALRTERRHVIIILILRVRHAVLRIEDRGPPVCVKASAALADAIHKMGAVVAEVLPLVNLNLLRIEVRRKDHLVAVLYADLTLEVAR